MLPRSNRSSRRLAGGEPIINFEDAEAALAMLKPGKGNKNNRKSASSSQNPPPTVKNGKSDPRSVAAAAEKSLARIRNNKPIGQGLGSKTGFHGKPVVPAVTGEACGMNVAAGVELPLVGAGDTGNGMRRGDTCDFAAVTLAPDGGTPGDIAATTGDTAASSLYLEFPAPSRVVSGDREEVNGALSVFPPSAVPSMTPFPGGKNPDTLKMDEEITNSGGNIDLAEGQIKGRPNQFREEGRLEAPLTDRYRGAVGVVGRNQVRSPRQQLKPLEASSLSLSPRGVRNGTSKINLEEEAIFRGASSNCLVEKKLLKLKRHQETNGRDESARWIENSPRQDGSVNKIASVVTRKSESAENRCSVGGAKFTAAVAGPSYSTGLASRGESDKRDSTETGESGADVKPTCSSPFPTNSYPLMVQTLVQETITKVANTIGKCVAPSGGDSMFNTNDKTPVAPGKLEPSRETQETSGIAAESLPERTGKHPTAVEELPTRSGSSRPSRNRRSRATAAQQNTVKPSCSVGSPSHRHGIVGSPSAEKACPVQEGKPHQKYVGQVSEQDYVTQIAQASDVADSSTQQQPLVKRKRGRPRKIRPHPTENGGSKVVSVGDAVGVSVGVRSGSKRKADSGVIGWGQARPSKRAAETSRRDKPIVVILDTTLAAAACKKKAPDPPKQHAELDSGGSPKEESGGGGSKVFQDQRQPPGALFAKKRGRRLKKKTTPKLTETPQQTALKIFLESTQPEPPRHAVPTTPTQWSFLLPAQRSEGAGADFTATVANVNEGGKASEENVAAAIPTAGPKPESSVETPTLEAAAMKMAAGSRQRAANSVWNHRHFVLLSSSEEMLVMSEVGHGGDGGVAAEQNSSEVSTNDVSVLKKLVEEEEEEELSGINASSASSEMPEVVAESLQQAANTVASVPSSSEPLLYLIPKSGKTVNTGPQPPAVKEKPALGSAGKKEATPNAPTAASREVGRRGDTVLEDEMLVEELVEAGARLRAEARGGAGKVAEVVERREEDTCGNQLKTKQANILPRCAEPGDKRKVY